MTRQQQLCNNKWFRLAVSVILTFAVLLVFVFSPFTEAHAAGVLGTELIDIIIAGLSACGITFTTTGGFGSLEDYVSNLIDEYAVDQNTTALGLLNGSQYGNNKLGQLLLNNRLVRFISAFATYIKARFTLANNQSMVLQSPDNVDGIAITPVPYDYRIDTGLTWQWYYTASNSPVYLVFFKYTTSLGSYVSSLAYSAEPFVMHLDIEELRNGEHTYYDYTAVQNVDYYFAEGRATSYNDWTRSGSNAPVDKVYVYDNNKSRTIKQIKQVVDGVPVAGEEIGITTGVINPPLDDENYEDGDGALVDVGSTWGATLKEILDKIRLNWQNVQAGNQDISMDYAPEKEVGEQLPEQTDIENLPGGTAWNPTDQQLKFFEFESIWHYVAQWISDFTSGASVVWNAAVQLPSPVVNMVYAMVTLAIIFGVIKVMRA